MSQLCWVLHWAVFIKKPILVSNKSAIFRSTVNRLYGFIACEVFINEYARFERGGGCVA